MGLSVIYARFPVDVDTGGIHETRLRSVGRGLEAKGRQVESMARP